MNLLWLIATLLGLVFGILVLAFLNRSRRLSLRTLMIVVTTFCIGLAGWMVYREANLLKLKWQEPTPEAIESFFVQDPIQSSGEDSYQLSYHANFVSLGQLMFAGKQLWNSKDYGEPLSISLMESSRLISVASTQRERLVELRGLFRGLDRPVAGSMVILGRVVDQDDNPVLGAPIDILGEASFINQCQTRAGGMFSFSWPLANQAAGQPACRFRVRWKGAQWQSDRFRLRADSPSIVTIVVPDGG